MQDFIVVDVETSGLIPGKHQIVSIGAVCSKTNETFYGECRIYEYDEYSQSALDINGFTIEQINDTSKMTPYQLYQKFIKWCNGRSNLLAGHNIGSFDIQFLKTLCNRTKSKKWPFKYQYLDTHSLAFGYFGESVGLETICDKLVIEREPKPHNALNGAKVELECILELFKLSQR